MSTSQQGLINITQSLEVRMSLLTPAMQNMGAKYEIKYHYVVFFNTFQDLGILKNTSKINIF